jgi:predicted nucleic acid-binding protein
MPTGYLFDTNFVSEVRKRRPNPGVVTFLRETKPDHSFVSAMTIGELRKGVAARRVRDVQAADEIAQWIDRLEADFAGRILPVDRAVARIWGELSAARPLPVVDTLIAATALAHDLTLVTRNVRDMAIGGIDLMNPWDTN